ncbi:MAG: DUF167 domain-containing protein [Aquiluna sp.]|nr:DUF167 domain-containing protein [Aquiluna sp.]
MKISVLVKPNKALNSVVESPEGLTVTLRAKPENGKANAALVCVLAEHFQVPKDSVRISAGNTGRRKIVQITKNPA